MIIYKCVVSGDEMFSDVYKIKPCDFDIFYVVEGKTITRKEGDIDESAIGANPSAEELCEASEESSVSGVDIILNHHLQTTPFDKKSYQTYIKGYVNAIKEHLKQNNPERLEKFMANVQPAVKKLLGNFKNYEFFTGESMNPDGMVGLLDYCEDGITPFMLFFKDGLEIEKC